MKTKIPKNITPAKFAKWLQANTNCQVHVRGDRVEAVIYADNIELGSCVPLLAEVDDDILMITEYINDYYDLQEARRAIDNEDDSYPPVPFHDWVQDQYLTARDVKITRVEI